MLTTLCLLAAAPFILPMTTGWPEPLSLYANRMCIIWTLIGNGLDQVIPHHRASHSPFGASPRDVPTLTWGVSEYTSLPFSFQKNSKPPPLPATQVLSRAKISCPLVHPLTDHGKASAPLDPPQGFSGAQNWPPDVENFPTKLAQLPDPSCALCRIFYHEEIITVWQ
jgi:hypothetical protein